MGIHLFDKYKNYLGQLLGTICDKVKPLPGVPSVRPKNFIINVSPKNVKLERELKILGANCVQKTFQLKENEKDKV